MFRKNPFPVTTLNPREHRAVIQPSADRHSVAPGAPYALKTRIENPTDTVWLRGGLPHRGFVRLGGHLKRDDRVLEHDFARADIGRDMIRGDIATIELTGRAPAESGAYVVELDMVNEGTCWFAEHGSPVARVTLEVGD